MLSDDRPHIGQNIRRARLAANLTQEQLASLLGLSQSHTSRLELSNPRDATIQRVADALHVRFEELKPLPPPKLKPWPTRGLRYLRVLMPRNAELRSRRYLGTGPAMQAISDAGQKAAEFLHRNAVADWGDIDPIDAARNDVALKEGKRTIAAYTTRLDAKLVIVTDAANNDFGERDNTVIYLPEEWEAKELGGQQQ